MSSQLFPSRFQVTGAALYRLGETIVCQVLVYAGTVYVPFVCDVLWSTSMQQTSLNVGRNQASPWMELGMVARCPQRVRMPEPWLRFTTLLSSKPGSAWYDRRSSLHSDAFAVVMYTKHAPPLAITEPRPQSIRAPGSFFRARAHIFLTTEKPVRSRLAC